MSVRRTIACDPAWLALSVVTTVGCYVGSDHEIGDDTAISTAGVTLGQDSNVGEDSSVEGDADSASERARVELTVVSRDGTAVAGARVVAGDSSWTTDANGVAVVTDLPPTRFVAQIEPPAASGQIPEFVKSGVVLDLPPRADVKTLVTLLPHVAYPQFDVARGGAVETPTVRVYVAPGSLVYGDGKPVTGMVTPTVVPIDPTGDLGVLPGPLRADEILLESVYMAEITLWQDGRPLQLAAGATAHVALRVPYGLSKRYMPGETLEAWWYDYEKGTWQEEEGVVGTFHSGVGDGSLWWHVDLPHLSLWNADGPVEEIGCVDVTLETKDGNQTVPLAFGMVTLVGTSYNGYDTAVTDATGHACLQMPRLCDNMPCEAEIYLGTLNDPKALLLGPAVGNGLMGTCNGDCASFKPDVPVVDNVCNPGDSVKCGAYSGPNGTEGEGVCSAPQQTCNDLGTAYGECEDTLPIGQDEPPLDCMNLKDEDCDGIVELGAGCACNMDMPCYTGTPGELADGPVPKKCHAGFRECVGGFLDAVCQLEDIGAPSEVVVPMNHPDFNFDDDCDGLWNEDDTPFVWATVGASPAQDGNQIATDVFSLGDKIFVAGHFSHGLKFAGDPSCEISTGLGKPDIFVAMFDKTSGLCEGLVTLDPHSTIQEDIRIAPDILAPGAVWLVGACDGIVSFVGMAPEDTCDAKTSFLARIDMNLMEVTSFEPLSFIATDVTFGNGNYPYIVGSPYGTAELALQAAEGMPIFRGNEYVGAKGRRIEFDGVSVHVAGTYSGRPAGLLLGGTPEAAESIGQGVFVARMTDALEIGTASYLFAPTSVDSATVEALTVSAGEAAVAGKVEGNLHVPPQVDVAFQTEIAAYVVAFNPDGTAKWHQSFNTSDGEIAIFHGLTYGPGGRLYAGGEFSGTITIAGLVREVGSPSGEDADMLMVQLDPLDGDALWSAQYGGAQYAESVRALAANAQHVVAVGRVGQDVQLGALNNFDTFVDWTSLADAFLALMEP